MGWSLLWHADMSHLMAAQVQGHPGKPLLYRNARHCLNTILQTEGFPALYRGLASSFMKARRIPCWSAGLSCCYWALRPG